MFNWEQYKPILVVPAVPNKNGIRFLCQDRQLDINGEIVILLWNVLSLCNGYRTSTDIARISNVDENLIRKIFEELNELEVINDSREQYRHFHAISSNPSTYVQSLSREEINIHRKSKRKPVKNGKVIKYEPNQNSLLYKLQLNRRSCRSFSTEKQLTLSQIGNICDYAYSLTRHSTPSGGALFPLKIYCVVTRNQNGINEGYYEYDAEHSNLVLYNTVPDLEQLQYCYNDEHLAFNSPLQIIIAADLERQPYKYSNRGYRLTLIEVGQVAQNISLYCEEQGLSTCELGGILDQPLSIELGIDKCGVFPLLAVAIGYQSNKHLHSYAALLEHIESDFVGKDKPIINYGVNSFEAGDGSFYGAWASYGKGGKRISGATGTSYYEAAYKAIIEAYERFQSGIARVDYLGAAENTKFFFKPNEIAPLSSVQRSLIGLSPYRDGDTIEWTKDMSGVYYLPTDFVYYGHTKSNKLYHSDSSGVAAYSDYKEAKNRAFAELIERDAVMRSWYEHRAPRHVKFSHLPPHIKNRMQYWKSKGRDVHILDLDSKYLPVFLVVIVSEEYPCFVSGAAAALSETKEAMIKALQEAEYNLLLALRNPISEPPLINAIKAPIDHGHYYQFFSNAQKITWIWSNNKYSNKQDDETPNIKKLIDDLEVVFVDLSASPKSPIKVVRAVSRKTVPISFGYQRDYYLHPELQRLKIDLSSGYLPHYFA